MIKTELQSNNLDLRALLDAINNLPEKGSGSGEDVSEEIAAQDILISEISLALDEVAIAQAEAFAAIGVTYPEGSTCTCSNGTKTLTAKDTSGQALFLFSEAGIWQIRCFDGSDFENSENKASETVEITVEGQSVNVELSYSIKIVSNGILKIPMSVYSAKYESGSATDGTNISVTQEDGYVFVAGVTTGYGMAYIETTFTNESEIILEGEFTTESSNAKYYRLTIWSAIGPYISSNVVAYQNFTATGASLPIPEGITRGETYYVGITTVYNRPQRITRFEIV